MYVYVFDNPSHIMFNAIDTDNEYSGKTRSIPWLRGSPKVNDKQTHLSAIMADDNSNFLLNENDTIPIRIALKFVPRSLPKPILTQFTDAYMRHQGEMS